MKRTSQESRAGKRAHLSPVVQFDAAQAEGNHARVIELGLILLEDPSTNHFKLHYCVGAAFQDQVTFDLNQESLIQASYPINNILQTRDRFNAKKHLQHALALAGNRSGNSIGVIHWRLATLRLYSFDHQGFFSHVTEMKSHNFLPDPFFFNWRMFLAEMRSKSFDTTECSLKYITGALQAADAEPAKYVHFLSVYERLVQKLHHFHHRFLMECPSVRNIPDFKTKDDAYVYWAKLRPFQKFCLNEKIPGFKSNLESFSRERKTLLLNLTCFTESTISEILSFIYIL